LDPNDPNAYLLLGRALQESGTLLEAVAAYEKSIELEPGQLHALAYLGGAYLKLGRLEEAREILSHSSGVSLNDPKFQYSLAELYLKLGMREEACREHEALRQLDPSLAEAFAKLLGSPPKS
jgi:tetratricopeptide (TPR) repeat protein